ncbi:MAG TPA: tetratricopeptide repeat protein [Candidatus Binataceae bacterium]|nr:tetratricopeptide repeat protein [Candidatus Binataceae bacterium]
MESRGISKFDPRAVMGAILIGTALVYGRSIGNEFVADDYDQVVNNPALGDWSFVWRSFASNVLWFRDPLHAAQAIYYRPLQDLWLWLNFQIFGLHPAGWHATMVALHLAVVWLAYRVASRLARDPSVGILSAALFALMPVHVQAVVWPAAVVQPLSAAFMLGAFDFYLRRADGDANPRWLAVSLLLSGCALLTYEIAIVFPLLIAAHAILLPEKEIAGDEGTAPRLKAAAVAMLPYAIETAVYLCVRFLVLGFIAGPNPNTHPLTAGEAILTIPAAIASYAAILAVPWAAAPAHSLTAVDSVASGRFFLPLIGLAALCAAGLFIIRSFPHDRLYFFCLAWILITLAPMLELRGLFAQVLIQDRYLYLPSLGLCVIVADLTVRFARGSRNRETAVWVAGGIVAAAFAAMVVVMQGYWRDNLTLFNRAIKDAPTVAFWHYRLGVVLKARGDYPNAIVELRKTLALDPDAGGNVLYDAGLVDERLGNREVAEHEMAQGLERIANPPPAAYAELAMVADAAGDPKGAEAALRHAEAMPGGAGPAALVRIQLQFLHGDRKGAEAALRDLLQREPDNRQALLVLGTVLSSSGRYEEALVPIGRASAIAPREPLYHYLLADSLHRLGRDTEARHECEIALSIAPNDPASRNLMAAIEHSGTPR